MHRPSVKANVWHQINAVISHFLEGTVMVHLHVLGFVDSKIGLSLLMASLGGHFFSGIR